MTGLPAAPYRDVRVMVLGASGFIGRWVARALAGQGAALLPVARDEARGREALRAWGVSATVTPADLADPAAIGTLIAATQPAIVFNLAGYGVDPAERDATIAERVNTDLPAAIADAMARNGHPAWGGQQVVHTGSALEYGTATGDLNEATDGTPTTLYGRTKLEGTLRLHAAAARLGVRATTGRLFTVYGPGEHDGRLLPTLGGAARSSGPVPLTPGTQLRDFTYVEEAAEGLLRLGALAAPSREIVNVATGRLLTVRQFVETAAEVLGIEAHRLAFGAIPMREEEMRHDPVRIERLRALTGWSPALSLHDGITRAVAFG